MSTPPLQILVDYLYTSSSGLGGNTEIPVQTISVSECVDGSSHLWGGPETFYVDTHWKLSKMFCTLMTSLTERKSTKDQYPSSTFVKSHPTLRFTVNLGPDTRKNITNTYIKSVQARLPESQVSRASDLFSVQRQFLSGNIIYTLTAKLHLLFFSNSTPLVLHG